MAEHLRKNASFRWTEPRVRAAVLLAEDELSDRAIAENVGVSPRTLVDWKRHPDFAAQVGDHVGRLQAAMLRYRVAKKRHRLKVLDDLHTKLLTVVDERADQWAAQAESVLDEPRTQKVYREVFGGGGDVPAGGGTGLVVRQIKQVGTGHSARIVEEFAVDTGTIREIRAIHEQAAKELGQWIDKAEVETRTTEVRIVGVAAESI